MTQTVDAKSKSGNIVAKVEVHQVVHSAGYTYIQYGALAPHQK